MDEYSVIVLGGPAAGKTTYLASLFKKLSTAVDYGFFLTCDDLNDARRLHEWYAEQADPAKPWQPGTAGNRAWLFSCMVQSPDLTNYRACRFRYHDYAGRILTEPAAGPSPPIAELDASIKTASSLLGLIDGEKLLSFMRGEPEGGRWAINDLAQICRRILERGKPTLPFHFVITKWDLLDGTFSLDAVRERLLANVDEFKGIVTSWNKAGRTMRLIPISALGFGFVSRGSDGVLHKVAGAVPRPSRVEAPLACVLMDAVKDELMRVREREEDIRRRDVVVKPQTGFLDWLLELVASDLVKPLIDAVPKKYRSAATVLHRLAVVLRQGAEQKRADARERSQQLEQERQSALAAVKDEESALAAAVSAFAQIESLLDTEFPASRLA